MGFFDFGRKFINSLPGVGGLTSSLWGDPSQEAVQKSYEEAQKQLAIQRANQMGGRMNAMNQAALAFGPRNQMLGEMMGMGKGQNLMDLGPMLQNPMPQNQQDDIRNQAFGMAPNQPKPTTGAFMGTGPNNPYRRY